MASESFDWRAAMQARVQMPVAWAADRPNRLLVFARDAEQARLTAWEDSGATHPLPPAAKMGYTWPTPDGETVYFVQDQNDSEVGHLMRTPWADGEPEPVAPDLPPMYFYGLQVGRDGTLYFAGSGQGSYRVYRLDAAGPHVLYAHANEAYLPHLSPDETLLAFCTSEPANNRHWQATVVDARTGERVAQLSDGDEFAVCPGYFQMTALDLRPWSPLPGDTRLLVTSNASGEPKPSVWDVRTGERVHLAQDLPGEVLAVGWTPDAQAVIVQQAYQGQVQLHQCDLVGGDHRPLPHSPGTLEPLPVFPDGTLWYRYTRLGEPMQTRALRGGQETVVIPPAVPGVRQRWESVHYRSLDGTEIQGFLGIPDGEGPFPTILNMHGGPTAHVTDMNMWPWQSLVAEGYLFFTMNFRGSTGYGRAFQEAINGHPGDLELEDMAAARDYLVARGLADPDRVMLYGGSYGGFLTLMGLTRQPALWRAGFALVPICNFETLYEDANQRLRGWARMLLGGTPEERPGRYLAHSPIAQVERLRAPVYLIAHRSDTRCPIRQVEQFLARLEELGKPYQAEVLEGGHSITNVRQLVYYHERLLEFAAKTLY